MRDDIETSFALQNFGKEYDLILSHTGCPANASGDPQLTDCDGESNATDHFSNAMSQDEVNGLFGGFAFVDRFLDWGIYYNGEDIKGLSQELCHRIYVRLKNDFFFVRDPKNHKLVCRGPLALFYSYPLAKIHQHVSGDPIVYNAFAKTIGRDFWEVLKQYYYLNTSSGTFMFPIPPAVVSLFPDLPSSVAFVSCTNDDCSHYRVSSFLRLLTCSKTAPRPWLGEFTGKHLTNIIAQGYQKKIYDLMGGTMRGYKPVESEGEWRDEFNYLTCGCNCSQDTSPSFPYLGCEYYNNNQGIATNLGRWNIEDRWANPAYGTPWNPGEHIREFNGLDYMLAFNLYRYKYFDGGYNTRVRLRCYNRSYPFLSHPNPSDNNNQYWLGSNQYPTVAKAVFSIESGNTIFNSNSHVTFKAGSDITLKPGFKVNSGGVFRAAIAPYDCQPDNISVPNATIVGWKQDSVYNDFFDFEIDTMINTQLSGDSADLDAEDSAYMNLPHIINWQQIGDTIWGSYNPDYIITADTIIYAPLGPNYKQVTEDAATQKITLYPNPASNDATVEYSVFAPDTKVSIYITTETGQRLSNVVDEREYLRDTGQYKEKIDTGYLVNGIYYCHILINNRRIVKKFSVLH